YTGEEPKVRALRTDPIGRMHQRKHLHRANETDDANANLRLKAARRWQALYEVAEIGGARAIDTTRDVVDGGVLTIPDTDRRRAALKDLAKFDAELGKEGASLLRRVLGDKYGASEVAAMVGDTSERAVAYIRRRIVECLDTVAPLMGYSLTARGPRR